MRAFARCLAVSAVRAVPALLVVSALLALPAFSASAQGPRGADTLSAGAVADSQAILLQLDATLKKTPRDAAVWYRRGMIGWALFNRAKAPNPPRGLDPTRLGRFADTSLRIAADLEPGNARYRTEVGRFLLASGVALVRYGASFQFEKAVELGRKSDNKDALSEALIEHAGVYWRRYDALVNRRIATTPGAAIRSISQALRPGITTTDATTDAAVAAGADIEGPDNQLTLKSVQQAIESGTQALPRSVTGEADYKTSGGFFKEAYEAAPANPRAFRCMAMHIADQSKWAELEAFARTHLKTIPWDPWGWMALGLALHRGGTGKDAAAAFDSAMTYFDPQERARIDRIGRVMREGDPRSARGTPAERAQFSRMYWLVADPLWSQSGNESRVEYFARVAYAEFRWTVDEVRLRGAETDRGNIFVRYGPPDFNIVFGPSPGMPESTNTTIWIYASGLMFSFSGQPTFATAETTISDRAMMEATTAMVPVRWDNLSTFRVDSMPTQYARFRSVADSIDVLFAADPPVDSIRASAAGRANAQVRGDFWMLVGAALVSARDSLILDGPGVVTWTARVAPGSYLYRAEASIEGGSRAARATAALMVGDDPATGFAARGFGLSDLVLATTVEPRGAPATRWNGLEIKPIARTLPRNSQISLVWENYEFGAREGSANYTVAIGITRVRSLAGAIAARITGGLASAARVDVSADRVQLQVDRAVPHSAAFVDHINLDLSDTPAGTYEITLHITDTVTGRIQSRTKRFVIRN